MSKNLPDKAQKGQTPQEALMTAFKDELEKVVPYLERLLPHKGDVEKFIWMTHVAVMRDPNLLLQNRRSLFLALLWCAYRDLEPGVEDGAWLVPFKKIVVPIPGYKGLIKKATETETVKDVQPWPIYEHDDFDFSLGVDPDMTHKPPKLGAERGKLIGAYVVITKPDGTKRFHVMDRPSIEKHRNAGAAWKAAPNTGPWQEWEEAMFLKTVIKQGFKYLPVKPIVRDLLSDDGRLEAGESVALLLRESGKDLPETLLGDDRPPPEPEPDPDTSEFDKLVVEKLRSLNLTTATEVKERANLLNAFVQEKADLHAKKIKRKFSVAQAKVAAVENFEQVWASFEEWLAKQPGAAAPPGPGTTAHPPEPPGAPSSATTPPEAKPPVPTINECLLHGKYEGDECPQCLAEREAPPPPPDNPLGDPWPETARDPGEEEQVLTEEFLALRAEKWKLAVQKGVPLDELEKAGAKAEKEITPDNFAKVAWLIDNWEPPKKGKK